MGCGSSTSVSRVLPEEDEAVNKAHFQVERVLGQGGFGKVNAVIKVKGHDKDKWYAMKTLSKYVIIERNHVGMVMKERNLLARLHCPQMVNMHYAFQDARNLYIVMDVCLGGDLHYQLTHSPHKCFSEVQARFYAASIICCLEYMHGVGVLHRDVKPENLLLEERGQLKVTDLGISMELQDGICTSTSGTRPYMAPEIFISGHRHTYVADFYSLGITVYQFLVGQRPYRPDTANMKAIVRMATFIPPDKYTDIKQIRRILIAAQERKAPSSEFHYSKRLTRFSPEAKDFVQSCLVCNPKYRLGSQGIHELMNHPWFDGIDWDAMRAQQVPAPFLPDTTKANCDTRPEDLQQVLLNEEEAEMGPQISPSDQQRFNGYDYRTRAKDDKSGRGERILRPGSITQQGSVVSSGSASVAHSSANTPRAVGHSSTPPAAATAASASVSPAPAQHRQSLEGVAANIANPTITGAVDGAGSLLLSQGASYMSAGNGSFIRSGHATVAGHSSVGPTVVGGSVQYGSFVQHDSPIGGNSSSSGGPQAAWTEQRSAGRTRGSGLSAGVGFAPGAASSSTLSPAPGTGGVSFRGSAGTLVAETQATIMQSPSALANPGAMMLVSPGPGVSTAYHGSYNNAGGVDYRPSLLSAGSGSPSQESPTAAQAGSAVYSAGAAASGLPGQPSATSVSRQEGGVGWAPAPSDARMQAGGANGANGSPRLREAPLQEHPDEDAEDGELDSVRGGRGGGAGSSVNGREPRGMSEGAVSIAPTIYTQATRRVVGVGSAATLVGAGQQSNGSLKNSSNGSILSPAAVPDAAVELPTADAAGPAASPAAAPAADATPPMHTPRSELA